MPVTNNVPERKSALSKVFNFNTLNAGLMGGLGGAAIGYYTPMLAFQLGTLALTGGFAAVPATLTYGAMASAAVLGGLTSIWNMKAVGSQSTFADKKRLHRRNNTLIAISTIGGLAAGFALSGGVATAITAISGMNAWLAFAGSGLVSAGNAVIPMLSAAYGAVTNYSGLNWDIAPAKDEPQQKQKTPDVAPKAPQPAV